VRLLDVLACVVQQSHDMVIVEGVIGMAAGSPDANEARGAEQAKLMGDGGFGLPDQCRQVAHTPFAVAERVDQADPCGIAEQLEDLGNRVDRRGP
jgi:hypothetical protein